MQLHLILSGKLKRLRKKAEIKKAAKSTSRSRSKGSATPSNPGQTGIDR
jgi:hypothetical protein